MKQHPSLKAHVTPREIVIAALLALFAVLAVAQGLGMLGAGMAESEHAAPVR